MSSKWLDPGWKDRPDLSAQAGRGLPGRERPWRQGFTPVMTTVVAGVMTKTRRSTNLLHGSLICNGYCNELWMLNMDSLISDHWLVISSLGDLLGALISGSV